MYKTAQITTDEDRCTFNPTCVQAPHKYLRVPCFAVQPNASGRYSSVFTHIQHATIRQTNQQGLYVRACLCFCVPVNVLMCLHVRPWSRKAPQAPGFWRAWGGARMGVVSKSARAYPPRTSIKSLAMPCAALPFLSSANWCMRLHAHDW